MKTIILVVVVSLLFVASYQYTCNCVENMCTNVPADNKYYLTDFCGSATTACGKSCGNCKWAYAADYKRFGCRYIYIYKLSFQI